jgi:hypothetical protein
MDKTELRKMIREEIRREFNQVLPKLIRESIGNVLAKEMKRGRPGARKVRKVDPSQLRKLDEAVDRPRLAAMMGYGDIGQDANSPAVNEIAGVPMEGGGLAAKEGAAGQAHLRDYTAESAAFADSVVPDEASFEGGVDAGGAVPMALVEALGAKAKKTLDKTANKANWRPGM